MVNRLIKRNSLILFLTAIVGTGASCQNRETENEKQELIEVGGPCDGCELMYEGLTTEFNSIDTSLDWKSASKKLIVYGSVVDHEGKPPTSEVILYYWHTDSLGIYAKSENQANGKRHGKLRGWVKPDRNGRFAIYTSFPSAYPNSTVPSHIHVLIKEPGMTEYWIDAWEFIGDPYLNKAEQERNENRGGKGLLNLDTTDSGYECHPLIILGKNIPGYPSAD